MKEGIHLRGGCGTAAAEPPVQEGKEGAGAGVRQGGAACRGKAARCGKRGEALVDGASEVSLA